MKVIQSEINEKERVIATLTVAAEERLGLIGQFVAQTDSLRAAIEALQAEREKAETVAEVVGLQAALEEEPWMSPTDPGEPERLRSGHPKVSIITPSYNQGQYLEHTIRSVLDQQYPNLEYIIIDGGSTDHSVDIIRKYEDQLAYWVSEHDQGQAEALNKGFRHATGNIIAWLNSDDFYYPGAIAAAVATFALHPELGLVYGRGMRVDAAGQPLVEFESTRAFDLEMLIHGIDYILQPATFMRRQALHRVGPLNTSMHYALDWDLWIRLGQQFPVAMIDEVLAASREYEATKTQSGGFRRTEEIRRIVQHYTGQELSIGYLNYLMETLQGTLNQFTLPEQPRLQRAVQEIQVICWELLNEDRLVEGGERKWATLRGAPPYADGWAGPELRFWREIPAGAAVMRMAGVHDRLLSEVVGPLILHASLDDVYLGVVPVLLPGPFEVGWPLPWAGEKEMPENGVASERGCRADGRHLLVITASASVVPSRFIDWPDSRRLAFRFQSLNFDSEPSADLNLASRERLCVGEQLVSLRDEQARLSAALREAGDHQVAIRQLHQRQEQLATHLVQLERQLVEATGHLEQVSHRLVDAERENAHMKSLPLTKLGVQVSLLWQRVIGSLGKKGV